TVACSSRVRAPCGAWPIVPRIQGCGGTLGPRFRVRDAPAGWPPDLVKRTGPTDVEVVLEHTGERPMAGATPDSLLALHDAGPPQGLARPRPGGRVRRGRGGGAG